MNVKRLHSSTPELSFFEKMVMEELRGLRSEVVELRNNSIADKKENIELKRQVKELHQLYFNTPITESILSEKDLRIKQYEAQFELAELKKKTKQKKHP